MDAATGFINNEPVQLALEGIPVDVLRAADGSSLPGPGLVVGRDTLETKAEPLRAFTAIFDSPGGLPEPVLTEGLRRRFLPA